MSFLSKLFGRRKQHTSSTQESFDEQYTAIGVFDYTEDGFVISDEKRSIPIAWAEITKINVFKKDLVIYDLVMMEIVCGESALVIDEESPGWYQFVIKSKEVFPSIPKHWDVEIIKPPFAENFSTIYERT